MKRSTKIATTIILTIGIAGGAAAIGKHKHGGLDRKADFAVSYIANELQLDSSQKQALDTLKEQLFIARETVHGDMSSARTEIKEILQGENAHHGYYEKQHPVHYNAKRQSTLHLTVDE